jgi:hypothetical protein
VDVELKQLGSAIIMAINKTNIFAYTNATASTNGAIMLGYDDAYDSVGNSKGVIYDNVRVIQFYPLVAAARVAGSNIQIDFTYVDLDSVPASFTLQSAANVTGPYSDVASSITQLGPGSFRAEKAPSGSKQFYRVRKL